MLSVTGPNDPVLTELDKEIVRLEIELQTARDMRMWWSVRHPNVGTNGATGQELDHHPRLPVNIGREATGGDGHSAYPDG